MQCQDIGAKRTCVRTLRAKGTSVGTLRAKAGNQSRDIESKGNQCRDIESKGNMQCRDIESKGHQCRDIGTTACNIKQLNHVQCVSSQFALLLRISPQSSFALSERSETVVPDPGSNLFSIRREPGIHCTCLRMHQKSRTLPCHSFNKVLTHHICDRSMQ